MCAKLSKGLSALAVGVALVSLPALAQEVSAKTYPKSHRTVTVTRPLYNFVPDQSVRQTGTEVWQTYPISPYGD
jgi:hypothetical protein